jgi:drug/metabolite transporter, DME family
VGFAAVATAAILWAFGGTYARTLIDKGASPLEITEARAWIAFLALGAYAVWRGKRAENPPHPLFVVALGIAIATANYFYYSAIADLPVAVAIVIQYTAPAMVVAWLAVVLRRLPSLRVGLALLGAVFGVALLADLPNVLSDSAVSLSGKGIAAALISAVAFAGYILLGERVVPAYGPEGALARGFGVASAGWIVVQATRGRPDTLLDGSLLPGIVLIAVVATIIPFVLFLWGLQRIGASRAGIVSTLEPLSAAILAYFWLDQTLDAWQFAGAALVVVAIAVVQSEREQAAPAPSPLE